jgi:DNA-binding CsgD family transcriptional regulator
VRSIDEFDTVFLTEIIGRIYEAAVEPALWNDFVDILESVYPGARVTLFGHEPDRPGRMRFYKNYAEDDLRVYLDHYIGGSPYITRGHRLQVGRPAHYEVMIGDDELFGTEYFNDYMAPRRLGHYGTGVVVERRPNWGLALSLADHRNDETRRARQLRLLQIVTPHLMRAFRLHRIVAAQKVSGDAAQAAFDRWAHAALVLNASGQVVALNRAADALLEQGDGLWLGPEGRLLGVDETIMRTLHTAIRGCTQVASKADPAAVAPELDAIRLPRPSGAAALRVLLTPVPFLGASAASAQFGPGTVLLILFDTDSAQRTPVDWIARQYGLTPSEQRLAEAIVNGTSLTDAAGQLGIQLSTARTRLKTIQAKTHCSRQADLVRLALSLPAMRRD